MTVGGLLASAWSSIRRWLGRPPLPSLPMVIEPPTNLEALLPPPPKDRRRYAEWSDGKVQRILDAEETERRQEMTWLHVTDLLELIPDCRAALKRLKRFDRDAYNFHKRYGARLLPTDPAARGDRLLLAGDLRDTVLENLPGTGLNYLWSTRRKDPAHDNVQCYAYFHKLNRKPWDVEPDEGARAFYEMTMVYDDIEEWCSPSGAAGFSFYVSVTASGKTRVLRQKMTSQQALPRGGRIHHRVWDVPPGLHAMGEEERLQQLKVKDETERTIFEYARQTFNMIINSWDATNDGFQIVANRPGEAAVSFSVPEYHAKRFFRDRAIDAAADGRRKRIYHTVAEHERHRKTGRIENVHAHYRGARKFEWKGEAIRIDPPEQSARFMGVGGVIDEFLQEPAGTMTTEEFSERLTAFQNERADQRGGYRSAETRPAVRGKRRSWRRRRERGDGHEVAP